MSETRILLPSDSSQFKELVFNNKKYYQDFLSLNLDFDDYYHGDQNLLRFGSFDNQGILQASLTVKIFPVIKWCAHTLMISRFNNSFKRSIEWISKCLDQAVEYQESVGIYTMYAARTIRDVKFQETRNIWAADELHSWRSRYVSFVECYIPPGQHPPTFFKTVTGGVLKDQWQVINSIHLKNQYRHIDHPERVTGDYLSSLVDGSQYD